MAGGDGCINGWSVNKGGRGCGEGRSASPAMRTKYRQHVGSHRVVSFWLLGLLVAWWATNLGETFGCLVCLLLVGYPPFLFNSPSFGCCVGWFSLLDLSVAWVW